MVNQYLPGVIQIPSSLAITAITQTYPMVVTIDVNPINQANTYRVGQQIKLNVPVSYKMIQANGLSGTIVEIDGSDLSLDIDATLFDPFVIPSAGAQQPAMISPNGSRNLQYTNGTSLAVPFQSLNNIGN
jgi:hypothetical protein